MKSPKYEIRCIKTGKLYDIINVKSDDFAKQLFETWKKQKRPPSSVKLLKIVELA